MRKSAIESLLELDRRRETFELPPLATHLKHTIHAYFQEQDFTFHIPGQQVIIHKLPVDLRMVFISIGKSAPYKVFYRITSQNIEVFLIRHPYQKPLD
ncbi:hypothetical protein J2Z64_000056 [Oceanobacillus polygoni]|uniref:Uncharacterized protein n=1 Tax=Oceanobacillus polygoni TaxID=1235259 RepID=A0A9X0YR39_9BACI|nr:hypothetical protein [Oceanobacillus polygoni]